MTDIKIYTDKIRLKNDKFWAACGSDELYPMAYSDEGEFLMARMEKTGSCRYVRNHYALNFEIQSGIRCGGDVYTEDENGNPVYDFTWINGVYRNFVKHGIKPIVELDFLPDKLTGSGGNVTQEGTEEEYTNRFYPNDWNKWSGLLKTFVRNLADEFGIEEIRTWYFEVWNEPDSWPIESWDMFYKLYDVFVDAVTSVDDKLRVGGPACFRQPFMYSFLEHVVNGTNHMTGEKGSRIDFISYHIYGMSGGWLDEYPVIMPTVQRFSQELMWIKRMIDKYPSLESTEFLLNEWGVISNYERCVADYPPLEIRNSEYSALFMAKLVDSIIEIRDKYRFNISMLLYWGFAGEDFFSQMFNGNRSLTTKNNICKPIQTFHEMLSLLGDDFVRTDMIPGGDQGIIASKSENSVSAMVYFFNEFDSKRQLPERNYNLDFCGLEDGRYNIKIYTIDEYHNNTYRMWQRMGCPADPNETQLSEIHRHQEVTCDSEFFCEVTSGRMNIKLNLPSVSLKFVVASKCEK